MMGMQSRTASVLSVMLVCMLLTPMLEGGETILDGLTIAFVFSSENPTEVKENARSTFTSELKFYGEPKELEEFTGVDPASLLDEGSVYEIVIQSNFTSNDRGVFVAQVFWREETHIKSETVSGIADRDAASSLADEVLTFIGQNVSISNRKDRSESGALNDKAEEAKKLRQWSEAIEFAQQALDHNPSESEKFTAHLLIGICARRVNKLPLAEEHLREAQKLREKDDRVDLELGNLAMQKGDEREAESAFINVRDKGRLSSDKARWNLALLYLSQGKPDAAQEQLDGVPPNSQTDFSFGDIKMAIDTARQHQAFLRKLIYWLIGGITVVLGIIIYRTLRKLQQNEALTKKEQLEYVFKSMGLLFNVVSVMFGTMLGLIVAS